MENESNNKKLAPTENKIHTDEEAIDRAMNKFRQYIPVNDLDQEKFDHYLEEVPQTIREGFKIFSQLCGSNHVVCEHVVNHQDKRVHLPIIGRTDATIFSEQDSHKSNLTGESLSCTPLSILELKTSFGKPMKRRKDGSRSFSKAKLPSIPHRNHLQQLAFYATALKTKDPKLVYVTSEGSNVFHKGNCADLEPENLKNYYEELIRIAIRRERLLKRYEHINDLDRMKLEIFRDVSPDWNHPFYWRIGNFYLNQARELWKNL